MAEWLHELAVGQWFETGGDPFEIVGIDVPAETVLVQHYDGTLEDFDFETWMSLEARACAAPEDCAGALDMARDDYGFASDAGESPLRYGNPLDLLPQQER